MGLRELKKTRTRQAIRKEAIRLFGDQGYMATTVEQICACAEISTATFYRYYRDKEDVVLSASDRDDLVEELFAGRPEGESVFDTIAALFQWRAEQLESDLEGSVVRLRLIREVPSLQGRRWASQQTTVDLLASLLAPRAGTSTDDHRLQLAITIAMAAQSETVMHWARSGGAESLTDLLSDALAMIEPVFSAWSVEPGSMAAS